MNHLTDGEIRAYVAIRVNEPAWTVRDHIGGWLRGVADWFDGRCSVAVWIKTDPPLSQEQKTGCLKAGVAAITHSVISEMTAGLIEEIMRKAHAPLYRDQRVGTDPNV